MSFLVAIELLVTIAFFVFVAGAFLIYTIIFSSIFRDAPFVPSPRKVADAMMELADVKPGDRVVDLGSGHGTILLSAARRGATVVGYELSWPLVILSWIRIWLAGYGSRARVIRQDFFFAKLNDIDVVACYLFPQAMAQMKPKFEGELKKGARVVSATFKIHGWIPAQAIHIANRPLFLYHIGKENK